MAQPPLILLYLPEYRITVFPVIDTHERLGSILYLYLQPAYSVKFDQIGSDQI